MMPSVVYWSGYCLFNSPKRLDVLSSDCSMTPPGILLIVKSSFIPIRVAGQSNILNKLAVVPSVVSLVLVKRVMIFNIECSHRLRHFCPISILKIFSIVNSIPIIRVFRSLISHINDKSVCCLSLLCILGCFQGFHAKPHKEFQFCSRKISFENFFNMHIQIEQSLIQKSTKEGGNNVQKSFGLIHVH